MGTSVHARGTAPALRICGAALIYRMGQNGLR
jgi:hypothetical protein